MFQPGIVLHFVILSGIKYTTGLRRRERRNQVGLQLGYKSACGMNKTGFVIKNNIQDPNQKKKRKSEEDV